MKQNSAHHSSATLAVAVACLYGVLGALTVTALPVLAQTGSAQKQRTSISPSLFLGKTFEQCVKILGKPSLIQNPTGNEKDSSEKVYRLYYKSSAPNVTRIILERSRYEDGAVPKTVNHVIYHFPKDKVTTWKEAFKTVGINPGKVTGVSEPTSTSGKKYHNISMGNALHHWETAEESLTNPPEYRHPNDNSLDYSNF